MDHGPVGQRWRRGPQLRRRDLLLAGKRGYGRCMHVAAGVVGSSCAGGRTGPRLTCPRRTGQVGPTRSGCDFGLVAGDVVLAGEPEVDDRCDDKREHHRDEQTADDGDGERLKHLRAGA